MNELSCFRRLQPLTEKTFFLSESSFKNARGPDWFMNLGLKSYELVGVGRRYIQSNARVVQRDCTRIGVRAPMPHMQGGDTFQKGVK